MTSDGDQYHEKVSHGGEMERNGTGAAMGGQEGFEEVTQSGVNLAEEHSRLREQQRQRLQGGNKGGVFVK